MRVVFPSVQFFETLAERLAADPSSAAGVEPSDAYCGFGIGDRLIVLEFDAGACVAVVQGGNPLDLDFVLNGSEDDWKQAISSLAAGTGKLEELVAAGTIEIQSELDEGMDLARAALPFLQAFLGQSKHLDLGFE